MRQRQEVQALLRQKLVIRRIPQNCSICTGQNKILTIFASVRIFYYVCDSIFLQRPRVYSLFLQRSAMGQVSHFGFRTAAVSSVENKTVVSLRPPVFRQYFHEGQLAFNTSFSFTNPMRLVTRNTWVSTAIFCCPNPSAKTTLAVFLPTPGSWISSS